MTPNAQKPMTEADRRLLAFLVRTTKLDAGTARDIEVWAVAESLSAIQALVARGVLSEEEIASCVANGLRLPLLNLATVPFDEHVSMLVKEQVALSSTVVPVRKEGEFLIVAMANPFDHEVVRSIEFAAGCRVRQAVAPRSELVAALERAYGVERSMREILGDIPGSPHLELVRSATEDLDLRRLASEAEGAPVVKMVNLMLADALAVDASDLHIEPGPNLVQVRYRIDGVLDDVMQIPKWAQNAVVARIKVMAKLDITERRVPQDGHLRVRYDKNLVDFRVSSLPTNHGEKIVMRVLNAATGLRRLDAIGLSARDLAALRSVIALPEGMLLVTGPTGSGKTTTLYSILQEILSPEINIVTIENPIEYQVKGISQVEVNEKQGLTFAGALRSILRQDPDVILVGEIRDRETAEVAFQAAQTGHLVLSTLHTNDTVSTITRLLELGIEHHVLASSLVGIVAQRLARTVCSRCAERITIAEKERIPFGLATAEIMRGKGCTACRNSGFLGRIGIYEILTVSSQIKKLIEAKAPESAIRVLAQQEGMSLLREAAARKIEEGRTTPEEVNRVVQLESTELRCPQCSRAVEGTFTICPYCRFQLQNLCESCGAELKTDWTSCPFCRKERVVAQPAAATPPPPVAVRGPAAESAPAAPALGEIDVPEVLIVDDSEEIRKIVRLSLEHASRKMRCDEASNGFEALGKVEARAPHLIVLDLMMPGMDGIEVCKRLRAKLSTAFIPIVMLTAVSDPTSKEMSFLAGTDDYLTKPFDRQELMARVIRLLERTYGWGRKPASVAA